MIKAVIFDFGGVLAEEGFREGLKAIAAKNRLDPDIFFRMAEELIYETGYVTGTGTESSFWHALRDKSGVKGNDKEFRTEILNRFVLRENMIKVVKEIRSAGRVTAILSDQTNWLDEINEKRPFFRNFDYVFNSYHLKKGKRDSSVFSDVCAEVGIRTDEAVFVDDNINNIKNAQKEGLNAIHFRGIEIFKREIGKFLK